MTNTRKQQKAKYDALIKTAVLWEYLAAHPGRGKARAYSDLNFSLDRAFCPVCAYTINRAIDPCIDQSTNRINCNQCPLWFLWPDGCYTDLSPYYEWCVYRGTERATIAARKIAAAARNEAKRIKGTIL